MGICGRASRSSPRMTQLQRLGKKQDGKGLVTHFGGGGEAIRLGIGSPPTALCLGLPVGQPGSVLPLTN